MSVQSQQALTARQENILIWGVSISNVIAIGCLFHSFTLFLRPLNEAFGWTATQMTGAFTLGLITADLIAIPVGHWVDRRGGHVVMALGAAFAAFNLAMWSLVDSLVQFYILWLAMGVAIGCTLGTTSSAVLTANVRDFRRGITILAVFSGLSSTVVIPVVSLLMSWYGWRTALIGLAVMQFLGPACINAFLLRGTVGSRTAEFARRKELREKGLPTNVGSLAISPLRTAIRYPAFWFIAIAASVHWFTIFALNVHLMPLLHQRGIGVQFGVLIFSLTGPAAVAARFILLVMAPNSSARLQGRIFFPLFASAVLMLILIAPLGQNWLIAYAIIYGMSGGVLMVVRQTVIVEIFGKRGYGAISGALTTVALVPRTCAPLAVAVLADTFHSYQPVLWIVFGLVSAGAVSFYLGTMRANVADG
jgi:MFS family permease